MITIIAARGCYSHHLANLLAVSTDATTLNDFFDISSSGDSHAICDSSEFTSKFRIRHFKQLQLPPLVGEKVVVITPSRGHVLDYVNNSFSKESNYKFNDWFRERLINRERIPEHYFSDILHFLQHNNVSTGDIRLTAPENCVWILREFLSYKIDNLMFTCYERYFMLTSEMRIQTTDFFDNFQNAFVYLVNSLGLKIKLPMQRIIEHNCKFVEHQYFNNIQHRCNAYVSAAINGQSMPCPSISIFDEAYIQSQLRHRGWEINVDNLTTLPDASKISTKLYPAHLKG